LYFDAGALTAARRGYVRAATVLRTTLLRKLSRSLIQVIHDAAIFAIAASHARHRDISDLPVTGRHAADAEDGAPVHDLGKGR
jgi:hypothetical protein